MRRLEAGCPAGAPGQDGRGLGPPRSSLSRDEFEAAVRAVVALIEAGECYQVNLTRRLAWDAPAIAVGSCSTASPAASAPATRRSSSSRCPTATTSRSCRRHPSASSRWRGRDVETRPIKGTGRDAARLVASEKDRAENVMIVDLARNDLGRVCEPGTITVPELCAPEHHPGLVHLVSTVRGTLRPDVGPAELLRATFPAASITGAPKPRVLQAIEDLEPVRRGVYCGAIGWLDTDRGRGDLSVAIRTFTIARGATFFGVGGGIVADSDPAAEWHETELKAVAPARDRGRGPGIRSGAAGEQPLMHVWLERRARRRRRGPGLPLRPRAARRRRRLRDAARLRGDAVRVAAPSRPARRVGGRARAARSRSRRAARRGRRAAGGRRNRRRAAAHHRHGRALAARVRTGRRTAHRHAGRGRDRPLAGDRAPSSWCPGPATSAARPRASRPSRTRTTSVPSPTRANGARPRPCSATRGASCARRPAPTCSSSRAASCGHRPRLRAAYSA